MTKYYMSPKEAQAIVVQWLLDGGEPNEQLELTYRYKAYMARGGCACAGAAIGQLVYGTPVDAREVGEDLYGDYRTFFCLTDEKVRVDDPTSVANYLSRLEPLNV
jgi:hypothetical protein